MINIKKQTRLHKQELSKTIRKLNKKKYKQTKQIRIPLNSYRQIMTFKKEYGKTGSFWIDEAWRWYQKQFNFEQKE